jgi:hypothetical protein
MNLMLNHILKNDLITNMLDKPSKIIYLYNSRHVFNCQWFKILFMPLQPDIQNIINTLYNCELFINLPYEVIIKKEKDIEIFEENLEKKTFVKYLYDCNYLNVEWLELFSEEPENDKTYILDYRFLYYHDKNLKHDNKIIKNKVEESKNYKVKYILLFQKDIDKENIIYKEMVKIGDIWKIFTTKYYIKNNNKNILWIFAENIKNF